MRLDDLPARPGHAGRTRSYPGWSLGPERTATWPDLDLWLLEDGHGAVRTPEGTFPIIPGSCLLLRGGEAYTFLPAPGVRMTHWFAHFHFLSASGRTLDHRRMADLPPRLRQLIEPDRVIALWKRLIEEQPRDQARAGHWFTALRQEIAAQERDIPAAGQPDTLTVGVHDLARRMRDDPADAFPIATWMRRLGLGSDRFRRHFAAVHGCSPRAYLTLQRLRLAEKLLAESSSPIADIAALAGYASQHFFSRHFRRHTGCSPSGFRRRKR